MVIIYAQLTVLMTNTHLEQTCLKTSFGSTQFSPSHQISPELHNYIFILFCFWILALQCKSLADTMFLNMSITVISPALKTAPEMLLQQICHCSPSHIRLVLNFTVLGVIFYCFISATR